LLEEKALISVIRRIKHIRGKRVFMFLLCRILILDRSIRIVISILNMINADDIESLIEKFEYIIKLGLRKNDEIGIMNLKIAQICHHKNLLFQMYDIEIIIVIRMFIFNTY